MKNSVHHHFVQGQYTAKCHPVYSSKEAYLERKKDQESKNQGPEKTWL